MRRAAVLLTLLTGCATTTELVPAAWLSVPEAPRIRSVQIDASGKVTTALQPLRGGEVQVKDHRIVRGDKVLTEAFPAIESFDVSEARGEVAFSAKRGDNFDVGLVSTDGSPISWIPQESVDEVGVRWASRGNKLAYIVRSRGGDFVRTVHIPTATRVAVDFESGVRVETFAWDPPGDKLAIAYSTPDASDRVDVAKYTGSNHSTALEPAETLPVEVASFAPGAVSLRPREMEYNETLPLVVWIDDEPYAWNDARADLIRNARVFVIVTSRLDESVWKAVEATPWVERGRTYVVNGGGQAILPVDRRDRLSSTLIVADPKLPAGRYRRNGATVAVAPDVVQSFAARFIADELKRTGTPNGSSR